MLINEFYFLQAGLLHSLIYLRLSQTSADLTKELNKKIPFSWSIWIVNTKSYFKCFCLYLNEGSNAEDIGSICPIYVIFSAALCSQSHSASNRNQLEKIFLRSRSRPTHKPDNFTAIYEPCVYLCGILDVSQPREHPGSVTPKNLLHVVTSTEESNLELRLAHLLSRLSFYDGNI